MPFVWEEYVNLAETLNLGTPTQEQMRSAISRAYYGAFCECRNRKGFSMDRGGDIHNRVITLYKESEDRCEFSIGNFLDSLRKNRNLADYDGFFSPTQPSTNIEINKAKSIFNLFDDIDNGDCD